METAYQTLSIASLGDSTLQDAKNKPRTHYVNYNTGELFANLQEQRQKKHQYTHETNNISDIEGAMPKTTKERNYVSKSLFVDDIDGARARFRDRFLQTNRHTNPMQPEYNLPSAEVAPAEPPPFRRDPLMVDDIEGTRTSSRKVFPGRDFRDIRDIDGTTPGWKPLHMRIRKESAPHDIFPVTENPIKKTFARSSTRQINPMQPTYSIHSTVYQDDDKTKPKKQPQYISDNHFLQTNDIDGAQAGFRSEHQLSLPNSMRKEFRNTNFIQDIEGAQANTKKNTFVTTRCSNPLQPVYQSLDGDSIIGGPVDSLVPANLVDTNTINFKSSGLIPERFQRNSTPQSKVNLIVPQARIPSGISTRSNSAHSSHSQSHSRQPSARDLIFPSHGTRSELNLSSTSTTSQYLDPDLDLRASNSRDGSRSYAEKFYTDAQVLIVNHQDQQQQQYHDRQEMEPTRPSSGSLRSSSSAALAASAPRRSLSAVPRLSRETFPSSNHATPRERSIRSQASSRLPTERSQQSIASGRKPLPPRSDSLSSKRNSAELEAEISAIRGL